LAMFDDVPWARVIRPAITAVSQPARLMGEQAAGIMAAPGPATGRQVRVLPTRVIVRQSCRPWHLPRRVWSHDHQAPRRDAGLRGVLVRTGKYLPRALAEASGTPDHVLDSVAGLPDLLG